MSENIIKTQKPQSQFQAALGSFRKNKAGVVCLIILALLYISAIFAGFLSPYSFKNESREYSYCPPTPIHIFDENNRLRMPFVYRQTFEFDEYHARVYKEDKSQRYPLRLFYRGDEYKFLGLIPTTLHLWGASEETRVFLLGADSRGRDLFSRLLYGGRISLFIGLIGVAISYSLGLLVGGIAGYYGGRVDHWIMRICEMFMMIPGFYLMLALRSAVPVSFNSFQVFLSIVVILSFIGWAGLARVIRGMSISLREREFVLAAKAMGLSDFRIIVKHILPHTFSYSIVAIMLSIPGYILGEAALSLIGLGIQDPIPSWGNLLSEAMAIIHVRLHPWVLTPGLFIFMTVMSFNVIGDTLRDCFDPMLRGENGSRV
jgi:peptide/nickel transport system permease protein